MQLSPVMMPLIMNKADYYTYLYLYTFLRCMYLHLASLAIEINGTVMCLDVNVAIGLNKDDSIEDL